MPLMGKVSWDLTLLWQAHAAGHLVYPMTMTEGTDSLSLPPPPPLIQAFHLPPNVHFRLQSRSL